MCERTLVIMNCIEASRCVVYMHIIVCETPEISAGCVIHDCGEGARHGRCGKSRNSSMSIFPSRQEKIRLVTALPAKKININIFDVTYCRGILREIVILNSCRVSEANVILLLNITIWNPGAWYRAQLTAEKTKHDSKPDHFVQ